MSTDDESPILSCPRPEIVGTDAESAWYEIVDEMDPDLRRKMYATMIDVTAAALVHYRKTRVAGVEDMTIRLCFDALAIPEAGQERLLGNASR